jgi:hypothetical protein
MVNLLRAYLSQELTSGGSETTIYLDRITTITGETVTTSHFATLGRGIISIEPDGDGETKFPEFASFEAVSGTTLTSVTRGLSALSNSVVAANKKYHPVGTPVVISVGVHNILDLIDYIEDSVAAAVIGGNEAVVATAGETLVAGDFVYLKNDGKWWKSDASVSATSEGVQLGIAQGAGATNGAITNGVMVRGLDTNQSGLVAGTTYYLSDTAGAISTSTGTVEKIIGVARSATSIYFDPNYDRIPKSDAPRAFVTTSAGVASATKGVKLDSTGKLDTSVMPATSPVVRTYLTGASPATWTKPAGLKYVIVEVVGGGGGGGGSTTTNENTAGGGGGGYSKKLIAAATLGATETVTIGAGGTAGAGTGAVGGTGGTSSFGSHCSATGGAGGNYTADFEGGAGGVGSGGDINVQGQGGVSGAIGANFSNGNGGSSVLGGGGISRTGGSDETGDSGKLYGGGGSGAVNRSGGDMAGGVGGAGLVIVTEYYI